MKYTTLRFSLCFLLLFVLVTSALAGPPLICHRFEIGTAQSLPWVGDSRNLQGNDAYDTKNLSHDTLAILDSNPVVLVHMETLRRATLYARKDSQAAKELLLKLHARANTRPSDALAWFDIGYLAASLQPVAWLRPESHYRSGRLQAGQESDPPSAETTRKWNLLRR